jgi:hypothetical protein
MNEKIIFYSKQFEYTRKIKLFLNGYIKIRESIESIATKWNYNHFEIGLHMVLEEKLCRSTNNIQSRLLFNEETDLKSFERPKFRASDSKTFSIDTISITNKK